jgi:hypothetical protein
MIPCHYVCRGQRKTQRVPCINSLAVGAQKRTLMKWLLTVLAHAPLDPVFDMRPKGVGSDKPGLINRSHLDLRLVSGAFRRRARNDPQQPWLGSRITTRRTGWRWPARACGAGGRGLTWNATASRAFYIEPLLAPKALAV